MDEEGSYSVSSSLSDIWQSVTDLSLEGQFESFEQAPKTVQDFLDELGEIKINDWNKRIGSTMIPIDYVFEELPFKLNTNFSGKRLELKDIGPYTLQIIPSEVFSVNIKVSISTPILVAVKSSVLFPFQ